VDELKIPNETTLLSFFESEPQLIDENIPCYYNELKYEFVNTNNEKIIITIAPSYSEFKLEVFMVDTNELLGILHLKNIETIDILSDEEDGKRMMVTSPYSVMKIDFAPRYKLFINQLLVN